MARSSDYALFRFNRSDKKMNRLIIISPFIFLLIICLFVLLYLLADKDPNKPPSALLNKDVPSFTTTSLYDTNKIINLNSIK